MSPGVLRSLFIANTIWSITFVFWWYVMVAFELKATELQVKVLFIIVKNLWEIIVHYAVITIDCKTVGLALCFQPHSRPFVRLLARTWIRKNTDCFAVYDHNACCWTWSAHWKFGLKESEKWRNQRGDKNMIQSDWHTCTSSHNQSTFSTCYCIASLTITQTSTDGN